MHSDRGGEFDNHSFNMELEKHGIRRQLTNPYTPDQNGIAERLNRTLLDMAIAMLSDSGLPKQLWAEAVTTAMYIRNRVLTRFIQGITPYEGWFGIKPSLGHLHVWGCLCYVLRDDSSRGKLDERSRPCALIGYSKESKGYRLFDPSAKAPHQVITSQTVVFLESKCLDMPRSHSSVSSSSLPSCLVSVNLFSDDVAHVLIVPAIPIPAHTSSSSSSEDTSHRSTCMRKPVELYGDWEYSFTAESDMMEIDEQYTDTSSFNQAMSSPKKDAWIHAMQDEIASNIDKQVWHLVKLPPGKCALTSKSVYCTKTLADGTQLEKARIIDRGFEQVQGVNFHEIFAPTIRSKSLHTLLAIGAVEDMEDETDE